MPKKSNHPNVILHTRKRASTTTRYARCLVPDTGKWKEVNLSKLGRHTEEAAEAWAIARSKQIVLRLDELSLNPDAPRRTETPLPAGVAAYLDECRTRHAASTVKLYATSLARLAKIAPDVNLEAWGGSALFNIRARIAADRALRPATVNKHLTHIKAACNYWRRRGWLMLSKDAISDNLRSVPGEHVQPRPMTRSEIEQFILSMLAHDEAQPRRHRWFPLLYFLLMTGMRLGEALELPWSGVELDADVPRIRVYARKTRRERIVELDVSPSIVTLLANRRQDGPLVFGPIPVSRIYGWVRSLRERHGVDANPDRLRETSASFCTATFGGSYSALRHGHGIAVAERNYLGLVRVPRGTDTMEQAMCVNVQCLLLADSA